MTTTTPPPQQIPIEYGDLTQLQSAEPTNPHSRSHAKQTDMRDRAKLLLTDKAFTPDQTTAKTRFRESYDYLTGLGFNPTQAIIGAWLANGNKSRPGKVLTQSALATHLGISRKTVAEITTIVAPTAALLRTTYLSERIPDVDEAVYRAAIDPINGRAPDRRLFYELAAGALLTPTPQTPAIGAPTTIIAHQLATAIKLPTTQTHLDSTDLLTKLDTYRIDPTNPSPTNPDD